MEQVRLRCGHGVSPYLGKDILVVLELRAIEEMLDDREVKHLIADGDADLLRILEKSVSG